MPAPEYRSAQLSARFQAAIGEALLRAVDWPAGMLVTVASVRVSADSTSAEVSVSVLPASRRGEALELLRRSASEVAESVEERLELRRVPLLKFTAAREGEPEAGS